MWNLWRWREFIVGYLVYNEMEDGRDADLDNVLPESLKTDI